MKRSLQTCGEPTSLTSLPPCVLHRVLSHLSAEDLAAVAMQDAYLRPVASDAALWRPLALARWPGAEAACTEHYAGDWHRLFLARAPMPHAFPLAADRVRAVTEGQRQRQRQEQLEQAAAAAAGACPAGSVPEAGPAAAFARCGGFGRGAGGLPQLAFEDVMRQTFSAGLACSRDRAVRRTAEWRGLRADLTWWAEARPEVVVAFIRSAHDALHHGGGWGGAAALRDAPWRRSAVAFVQDLGLLNGAHASVVNRVAAEAACLDTALRSLQREAAAAAQAAPQVPAGVPASHWWFG